MIAYLEYHLGSVTNSQKQSIDWWLPGFEEGGNREVLVKGYKVSVTKNEYVLELYYNRSACSEQYLIIFLKLC